MGVFDGVYKLDMTQADPNWAALHKEMGKKGANAVGARLGKKHPRYPWGRLQGNDDPRRERAHDDGDGEQGREHDNQHKQHQPAPSQFKLHF